MASNGGIIPGEPCLDCTHDYCRCKERPTPSVRYATIVADPPWDLPPGGSAKSSSWFHPTPGRLPYKAMSVAELAELPVDQMAAADAHLYLWVVNAFVEQSYALARCWGFRPVTLLTWCKTPRGLGLGGAYVQSTEFILFCRRGSLKVNKRVDTSWWNWKRPEQGTGPMHSRKPEAFLDLVEEVSPGPYLELFARRARLGWDVWGNEVDTELVFSGL